MEDPTLIVTIIAAVGTWFGAIWTRKAAKGVKEINLQDKAKEYDKLLKQCKYQQAFEMLIENSQIDSSFYELATKVHFKYFGLGYPPDLKNEKVGKELIKKVKKSKLNRKKKKKLTRMITSIFLSDGTVKISYLS